MSDTISPDIIDRSKYMTLDEANRKAKLFRSSIVYQCRELVLDCRPLEESYYWVGIGIVDRKPYRMPELGLLLEESRQLVLRRLQNLRYNGIGFNLVRNLKINTGGKILELTRPSLGRIEHIPAPELLVPADLELYKQEGSPIGQLMAKAETVMDEGVLCLVWDHEAEKLEKLAKGLEQGSYIESAEIWCQHFRTPGDSPLKKTTAPPIKWCKYKKLIHIVLGQTAITLKGKDWKIHFGISRPGGRENEDDVVSEIIKQAMQ